MTLFPLPALAVPTSFELELLLHYPGTPDWPRIVTGVGPGEVAMNITRFLERKGAHTIILAGIAGAFPGTGPRPGDVCVATSEAYADLGRCTPGGIEPITVDGAPISGVFPLENHIEKLVPQGIFERFGLVRGPMVTVCCASGTEERIRQLKTRYGCVAENMEGAAAAQVCQEYRVPFLEVRGISNWTGDLDHDNWVIEPSLQAVSRVLEALDENWQEF